MFGVVKAAAELHRIATAVLAGTPVQVYVVAVVVMAVEAIVHTHAALVIVPAVPSLKLPLTSSFATGAAIPIPIFHPLPYSQLPIDN